MAMETSYHSSEYYKQQRSMLINGDPRALVCFCVDVSQSMEEWWIQEGGLRRHTGSGYSDGHGVNYFNVSDIRPGYEYYKKIDKLNEVLIRLLEEFKRDPEIRTKVAISIVVYSRYGRVLYDFLDCAYIDTDACRCKAELPETAMGDGLRTALAQIDEMTRDLQEVGKDSYTPILVFMTDGTPTDDPRNEFGEIRSRAEDEKLHVFPLGIGEGADMTMLRNMFPTGKIPPQFSSRYKMVRPRDYAEIFQEIKGHIKQRNAVMVSEGNSPQSRPALENEDVQNNQMGEFFDLEEFFVANV